jgi:hypothetical protein
MAVITKTNFSLGTQLPPDSCRLGSNFTANEALAPGELVYIKSDGKIALSGGSGVTALTDAGAKVHGVVLGTYASGDEGVAVYTGVKVVWDTAGGLTPGAYVYLDVSASTKGRLNTATASLTGGDLPPVGFAVSTTEVFLFGSKDVK